MTSRCGPIARAARIAAEDEATVRAEISRSRRGSGLSQESIGRPCGLTRSQVARTEAGSRRTTIRELACLGAGVGLDVRFKAYPAGDALRDAGQQRLLERLRTRLHPALRWATEVPLPIEGDLRAWDAVIRGDGWRLAVEAETMLDELQALERRRLKRRDGGLDHLVPSSPTRLATGGRSRRHPARSATCRSGRARSSGALRAGRDPTSSGLVIL